MFSGSLDCTRYITAIVLLGWVLMGRTAFAEASQCSSLFAQEALELQIQQVGPHPIPSESLQFLAFELNTLAGDLKIPKLMIFAPSRETSAENHFYNLDETKIIMSTFARTTKDRDFQAIFAHEFGHAVFGNSFQIKIKGQQVFPEHEIRRLSTEIGRRRVRGLDTTEIELQQKYLIENILNDLTLPYNELFADLFSALYLNDKRAVADALQIPNNHRDLTYRTQNRRGQRPRDFSSVNQFKDWKQEQPGVNEYTLLDPVRGVLFKYIEKHDIQRTEYHLFLKSFLKASEQAVNLQLEKPFDMSRAETPQRINQQFLHLLLEQMKNYGLR